MVSSGTIFLLLLWTIYGSVETNLFLRSTRFNPLLSFLRYGDKWMLFRIVFSILIPYIRSLWVLRRVLVFIGSTLQSPNGHYKLNCDGSVNSSMKKVAVGGVFRDSNGQVIFAYALRGGSYCGGIRWEKEIKWQMMVLGTRTRSRIFKAFG